MLTDADATVIVGTKAPGSAVPMVVGYDPKSKRILWQRVIPSGDTSSVRDGAGLVDLGGGRFLSQFELTSGGAKLAAIDAKTGASLWETDVPHSKSGLAGRQMALSPTRVYLPHWTELDVFDAKTGNLAGTIGK